MQVEAGKTDEHQGKHASDEKRDDDVDGGFVAPRSQSSSRKRGQKLVKQSRTRPHSSQEGVEQKQEEEFVVVESHTVVDPRAVVVHPLDAAPTHAAMMHSVCLHIVTLSAVPTTSSGVVASLSLR